MTSKGITLSKLFLDLSQTVVRREQLQTDNSLEVLEMTEVFLTIMEDDNVQDCVFLYSFFQEEVSNIAVPQDLRLAIGKFVCFILQFDDELDWECKSGLVSQVITITNWERYLQLTNAQTFAESTLSSIRKLFPFRDQK
jgi:hypothetical protein